MPIMQSSIFGAKIYDKICITSKRKTYREMLEIRMHFRQQTDIICRILKAY